MALSLKEQLLVQRLELKPTAVEDSLIELVHASAINYARDFSTTYKQFDTVDGEGNPQNQKANSYLTKMLSASQRAITSDSSGRQALMVVMSSMIANITEFNGNSIEITPELIQGASSEHWEQFINENIQRAFELFANVRIDEKAEYNNLPA